MSRSRSGSWSSLDSLWWSCVQPVRRELHARTALIDIKRFTGVVKSYSSSTGFGFVKCQEEGEYLNKDSRQKHWPTWSV